MEKNTLPERITLDPIIGHGKPTIRGTRYLVESILEYLSGGDSVEDILTEFSDLEKDDILACITYATEVLKHNGLTYSAA